MTDETLLWAYGVVPVASSAPGGVAGFEGGAVEPIGDGELAVLASPVPAAAFSGEGLREQLEDLTTLGEMARTHDAVLDAALRAGDVLPFRICTLYESAGAVTEMLASERERFAGTLRRLHGKAEWGVKGFARATSAQALAGAPSSGTEYLTRRREQRDSAAASGAALEAAAAETHARLAECAGAAKLVRLQDRRLSGREEEMVLNGAYLVDRDAIAEFRALVTELGHEHGSDGLTLELTGPWPPYHFAEEPVR